ncbi:MAG: XdhC family protein [Gammaproteobacteria bacterium]|jgi:xanthine/CO dehydrogenase XdhC/CoxF family maturation factor|nr:XdhC family protein [Gammaproteobacteria bacterium]
MSATEEPTEVLTMVLAWLEAGRKVALATVVETSGFSPRPVGSNLVVATDGAFAGSVSGGCVEGKDKG